MHIMQKEPQARNNDNYLYLQVLKAIGQKNGIDLDSMSVTRFLLQLKPLGFPAFESVGRARRKIQADYPELAANSTVEAGRMLNEEVFRSYAKGCV